MHWAIDPATLTARAGRTRWRASQSHGGVFGGQASDRRARVFGAASIGLQDEVPRNPTVSANWRVKGSRPILVVLDGTAW